MGFMVHRPARVDEFLDEARDLLMAHEAEHNAILGLCSAMQARPEVVADDPPAFATVLDRSGAVVLAGLRIPPYNQQLSLADGLDAVDALVKALRNESLPGVLAPTAEAVRFAGRWTALTGQTSARTVAERLFRLERVIPPTRPASGSWRLARPTDRQRLADWLVAFSREALPDDPPLEDPLGAADRWMSSPDRFVYVWEDGGEVVSIAGAGGRTPNGIRISTVYTPPNLRRRGYASALTAAVSQDQLDRGRRFCFLFTDLANPTSNKIYQGIGYRPVCDFDLYRFGATDVH